MYEKLLLQNSNGSRQLFKIIFRILILNLLKIKIQLIKNVGALQKNKQKG